MNSTTSNGDIIDSGCTNIKHSKMTLKPLNKVLALCMCFAPLALCTKVDRSGSDYGDLIPGAPPIFLTSCVAPSGGGTFGIVSVECQSTVGVPTGADDRVFTITLADTSPTVLLQSITFEFPTAPSKWGFVRPLNVDTIPYTSATGVDFSVPTDASDNIVLTGGRATASFSGFTGDKSGKVVIFFSGDAAAVAAATSTPEPATGVLALAGLGYYLLWRLYRKTSLRRNG